MASLNIGIVGAGRVGTTLGSHWSRAGHGVTFGVRRPADPKYDSLRSPATVSSLDSAFAKDVILIAIPWGAVEEALTGASIAAGSLVIDATNPLAANMRSHQRTERSGAEQIAGWVPEARVVKAFNSTGSGNMANPIYPAGPALMPIAGDDADAKTLVFGLAADAGFDPVDVGPLSASLDIEHLAVMWIRLAYTLGHGSDIAFSLMKR